MLSFVRTVRRLRRHPLGDRRAIEDYQNEKLRQVIAHAYARVPFYRKLFDNAGLKPDDVKTIADIHRVPIVTKRAMLEADPESLIAAGLNRSALRERRTSGTTGEPFRIWRTKREELLLGSVIPGREFRSLGVTAEDRVAHVKMLGAPVNIPPVPKSRPIIAKVARRIFRKERAERVVRVNAGLPVDELIEKLREVNPTVIGGYASTVANVARRLDATGDRTLRPRLVISGSEVLTPAMRKHMERGFGANVFDTYGSHEVGRIATECVVTGAYHIADDSVLVEVENDGVPAEAGNDGSLIATSLHSLAMPFIRYRIGDIVVRGPERCSCGSPFRTLTEISGRMYDFFRAADGTQVSPHRILDTIEMDALGWIAYYHFLQEADGRVVISMVPAAEPTTERRDELKRRMAVAMGPGIEIEIRILDAIPHEEPAKTRRFMSGVESDYA